MNKRAVTSIPINDLSAMRWSPRAFLEKAVEEEKIRAMFEAARWSASGGNEQPWRFILGLQQDASWKKLFASLDEGNQVWCRHVPVLILAVANTISSWDGNISGYYQYDTGQAVAHLSLEAMHQGLHVHQMGGFSVSRVREDFNIPADYAPMTIIAAGYLGDPDQLDEKLKKREQQDRQRRPLTAMVFSGKFGDSAPGY